MIVSGPRGAGPAEARNWGAQRATGDLLVFVDADVVVHPDVFVEIRAAFEADPELTALFGSYDDEPAHKSAVSIFRNLLHHHVHQSSRGPAKTFWAGLGAIRRQAFLAVGGFNSASFGQPSVEDVELGMRLTDAGHRVELRPDILGTHLKRWTLTGMIRSDVLDRGLPWVVLLLNRNESPAVLNLAWRHRLSAGAAVAGVSLLRKRRPLFFTLALTALIGLNRSFYALLWRKHGARMATAGVGLHALHHLSAVAAVPLGVLAYLRSPSVRVRSIEPLEDLAQLGDPPELLRPPHPPGSEPVSRPVGAVAAGVGSS